MEYKLDPRYDESLGILICNQLGINLHNKTTGKIMTNHGDHGNKSPCLSVNLSKNSYHCFSCGESGTLTSMYYDAFGSSAYIDFGRGKKDGPINKFKTIQYFKPNWNKPLETSFNPYITETASLTKTIGGRTFLANRNFNGKLLNFLGAKFCIKGYTEETKTKKKVYLYQRVIIPIYDKNKLISIEARDPFGKDAWKQKLLSNGKNPEDYIYKKVLYPSGSSINTLWNLDNLKTDETLYLTEGLMDAISLYHFPKTKNVSCLFHNIPTERQIHYLKKFKDIVYIPDNDLGGLTSLKYLKKYSVKCKILFVPEDIKDANDFKRNLSKMGKMEDLFDDWIERIVNLRNIDLSYLEQRYAN